MDPWLLIALSGVMKLSGNPKLLEAMTMLGVGRHVRFLGVMELAFATLFVIPATFKLGFLLASCYFAGAIATELSHDDLKVNSVHLPMQSEVGISTHQHWGNRRKDRGFTSGGRHSPCGRDGFGAEARKAQHVASALHVEVNLRGSEPARPIDNRPSAWAK